MCAKVTGQRDYEEQWSNKYLLCVRFVIRRIGMRTHRADEMSCSSDAKDVAAASSSSGPHFRDGDVEERIKLYVIRLLRRSFGTLLHLHWWPRYYSVECGALLHSIWSFLTRQIGCNTYLRASEIFLLAWNSSSRLGSENWLIDFRKCSKTLS